MTHAASTTVSLAVAESTLDGEPTTPGNILMAFVPFSSYEKQKEAVFAARNVEIEEPEE